MLTEDGKTVLRELEDVFGEGNLEVWYLKPAFSSSHGSFGYDPEAGFMEKTHVLLGSIPQTVVRNGFVKDATLDEMWVELQGENWSPNGEANELIQSKGLQHTSMSVGDCFRFSNGDVIRIDPVGMKELY